MFSKILYRSVFLVNPWARHHYSPSHTEKNEVDCSCLPWSLPWPSSSNPNSNRSSVDHLGGPSTKLWFCFWPRGLLARQPWENGYNLRGHGFLVFDWGALLRQNDDPRASGLFSARQLEVPRAEPPESGKPGSDVLGLGHMIRLCQLSSRRCDIGKGFKCVKKFWVWVLSFLRTGWQGFSVSVLLELGDW